MNQQDHQPENCSNTCMLTDSHRKLRMIRVFWYFPCRYSKNTGINSRKVLAKEPNKPKHNRWKDWQICIVELYSTVLTKISILKGITVSSGNPSLGKMLQIFKRKPAYLNTKLPYRMPISRLLRLALPIVELFSTNRIPHRDHYQQNNRFNRCMKTGFQEA